MAELEWEGRPKRPMLRRAIRHRLRRFDPTIRVVAEGFLAEGSEIDLLAIGGEGELISLRIGRGGDDAGLMTRALSDMAWLRPRIADFLKLAPTLGLEGSAEPRAILCCPDFGRETQSAASFLPPRSVELWVYRSLRERGQLSVLLEASESSPVARPKEQETRPGPALETSSEPVAAEERPPRSNAPSTESAEPSVRCLLTAQHLRTAGHSSFEHVHYLGRRERATT